MQSRPDVLELHDRPLSGRVHRNLPVAQLIEMSLKRGEAQLASNGALVALTGKRTGRSPGDKFVVRDPSTEARIAWGSVNRPLAREHFQLLHNRVREHLKERELFVFDGFAGADPDHRLPIRCICEHAWHALFVRQLFLRPTQEELAAHTPQFTVIAAPNCLARPGTDGTRSEAFVVIDFESHLALIGGTHYAGEMKKSIFTVMNYLMPMNGVLPMHCSANAGDDGNVALFFGLSGTGKTSLSADVERHLIGDDEHGWGDKGVFNFEGGCYAKCIRLTREREPQIWDAIRFGAVVENVVVDPMTRHIDYAADTFTENTRAAYPLDFISNAVKTGRGGHPRSIIFLAADAFGILPPISRLTETQAMYHFLSGYTAKLAGTESGMSADPQATFSACFGAPFLPLPPRVYADMLADKMRQHQCRCYLMNTGWIAGPFGTGYRIPLEYNRLTVHEILSGNLDNSPTVIDPVFGFAVPQRCGEISPEILNPRHAWKNKSEYDAKARDLARLFIKNFEQYAASAPHIRPGGPAV